MVRGFFRGTLMDQTPPLKAVRSRIDEIDAALLRLVDERAALGSAVAEAKRGDGAGFGLRPAREAQILRRLLALPLTAASPQLVVGLWRQLMADSLIRRAWSNWPACAFPPRPG
jgi:chorismate mutase